MITHFDVKEVNNMMLVLYIKDNDKYLLEVNNSNNMSKLYKYAVPHSKVIGTMNKKQAYIMIHRLYYEYSNNDTE